MIHYMHPFLRNRNSLLVLVKHLKFTEFSRSICWNAKNKLLLCSTLSTHSKEQRRYIFPFNFYNRPGSGFDLPGQGLNKEVSKEHEEKSLVLRYINQKIEEQEKGKETLPILPDYKFWYKCFGFFCTALFTAYLLLPDIKNLVTFRIEKPLLNDYYQPIKPESISAYVYLSLPLRFISRIVGRLLNIKLVSLFRKPIIGSFCFLTGVNIHEAEITDKKQYKSLGAFFRRPIKSELRPINPNSNVVSPSDGNVLVYGEVTDGEVEQVKGITYSLQSFLGPLMSNHTLEKSEVTKISSKTFQKSLLRDPLNNNLYQCVVYLAPKDYHGFHSPTNWTIKKRRHFPGQLLSVNPKVAKWIKDLFVLNERVVLSGEWEHGFFSMSLVGATNVGSIKIYGDALLQTNQTRFKSGTYYELDLGEDGIELNKGDPIGEFNLGSTVVLLFEAPKTFDFDLCENQKVKYGQKLEKLS